MKNVALSFLFVLIAHTGFTQQSAEGIPTSTMSAEKLNADKIQALAAEIEKGTYPNIHSLLISRNNKLVYENYWPGKDELWGNSIGVVPHSRDSLHDLRSVSKSIVSACVGIAIQQGKIKSVHQKVLDFFPQYAAQDTGLKSKLTVEHLLTMSSGLVWNEDVPYDNPENSEIRMVQSPDPVGFVLTQPMEAPPGKVWKYNGGTTQLLAAILEHTTGKKVDQFAKEYLFAPLGITQFAWTKYPGTDMPAAASGLRLRSRDMLKFGLLYNNEGRWNSKQVVPASWVKVSMEDHVPLQGHGKGAYGYQFWIWYDKIGDKEIRVVNCVGNGDQRIIFDKEHKLVVVITAGNYNKWDIKKNSAAIMREYVGPALEK